jgi:redox-sensitive bicupin YhaK (pirin superfamily)
MSAGTGIAHSEFNLEDVTTKIFQIWIIPDQQGEAPSWGAKPFPQGERAGQFVILASGHDGDEEALRIRADARLAAATLSAGQSAEYPLGRLRKGYLVAAKGRIEVNGVQALERDGVAIAQEEVVRVTALEDSEVILVDVA